MFIAYYLDRLFLIASIVSALNSAELPEVQVPEGVSSSVFANLGIDPEAPSLEQVDFIPNLSPYDPIRSGSTMFACSTTDGSRLILFARLNEKSVLAEDGITLLTTSKLLELGTVEAIVVYDGKNNVTLSINAYPYIYRSRELKFAAHKNGGLIDDESFLDSSMYRFPFDPFPGSGSYRHGAATPFSGGKNNEEEGAD